MDSGNSMLKMGRWFKDNRIYQIFFFYLVSIFILLIIFSYTPVNSTPLFYNISEEEIKNLLKNIIPCQKIEVKIEYTNKKPTSINRLTVKLEEVLLRELRADYMTLVYEKPVIDLPQLKNKKELKILSYSKNKVGILITPKSIERYLFEKANRLKKRYNRISIKFTPPFIECLFDVPASEISPETLKLLNQFVKHSKLEGYAAFQIRVKENVLHAFSNKVIVNHFLIPELILKELQSRFNPFDSIPVLNPFQYSISNATVQNKYIFLSN